MPPIVIGLQFDKRFQMLARPTGGNVSPEIEFISHARKSARYMTVKVTVDGNMSDRNAWFYAGLQAQEIIEWE